MSTGTFNSFERNRYYHGKLMTVRDFQTEQNYFNGKRHLLNRLIHGTGIVFGLEVKPEREQTNRGIVVQPGAALDCCGREIIVSREYKKMDIRELPGYPLEASGDKKIYVKLHYDESPRDRVRATTNGSSCGEACESNRILESFKVQLTTTAPEPDAPLYPSPETAFIYSDETIQLERTWPRWIRTGEVFEISLKLIVKRDLSGTISIKLREELPSLTLLHTDGLLFHVENPAEGTIIEKKVVVRAGNQPITTVIRATLYDIDDGKEINPRELSESTVSVVSVRTFRDLLIERYLDQLDGTETESESESDRPDEDGVVIASLDVNDQGLITGIEHFLTHVVYGNPLLAKLLSEEEERFRRLPNHGSSHEHGGDDAFDVTNLPGLLEQPQKIKLYKNEEEYVASLLNIDGEGVTLEEVPESPGQVRVTIPGMQSHAYTHAATGYDPLNVTNLPGVLAEAQKVIVYTDGDNYTTASKFSFEGSGVEVKPGPYGDDHLSVHFTGGPGGGAHAKSHQYGGYDPINVTNLPGVLAEPQTVEILYGQERVQARGIYIHGDGVTVSEDNNYAYMYIPKPPEPPQYRVWSGDILFQNVLAGQAFVSDPIYLSELTDPAITYVLDYGHIYLESHSDVKVIFSFNKAEKILSFSLKNASTTGSTVNVRVRWWALPKTIDKGTVNSRRIVMT
ncbi:MAG: hypothetical protein K0Q81_463 [Paenibacillus sp.]|nr:hypothetical protein [Paenibacillus sp.]